MKTWNLNEAQQHLQTLLDYCAVEPQVICHGEKPVGVVVASPFYQELHALWKRQERPTIAQMLDELRTIKETEPIELEIPPRQNRAWTLPDEVVDELSV